MTLTVWPDGKLPPLDRVRCGSGRDRANLTSTVVALVSVPASTAITSGRTVRRATASATTATASVTDTTGGRSDSTTIPQRT
jgi:hypothetical protein